MTDPKIELPTTVPFTPVAKPVTTLPIAPY